MTQELRWLLRDKYHWNELQIQTQDWSVSPEIVADVERLRQGEPLAYVIGWVNFLNCHIDVSLHPLIPRPETEYWVGELLKELDPGRHWRILDMCCGSGCIGVSLQKNLPMAEIDFVDVDPRAIAQSRKNAAVRGAQFFCSNVFSDLPKQRYDIIVCNPPYIPFFGSYSSDILREPKKALFTHKNGLRLIEKVILESKNWLFEGGALVMEFGNGQERAIKKMIHEGNEWATAEFRKDQFGVMRWVKITGLSSHLQN